jgi:hypothetical protein
MFIRGYPCPSVEKPAPTLQTLTARYKISYYVTS